VNLTYKATGINLKGMPLGESDRLLTILTREYGLIRAVAPGARKHRSRLGGRSELFVVNELMLSKGRSLDKITQAETLESYAGLSRDLGKLTVSQYLAELTLYQALSEQPQDELFAVLSDHLSRLEQLPTQADGPFSVALLAHLTHATFHLLAIAGVAPQVQLCCITQEPIVPNWADPNWRIGFSLAAGGTVDLSQLEKLEKVAHPVRLRLKSASGRYDAQQAAARGDRPFNALSNSRNPDTALEAGSTYRTVAHPQQLPKLHSRLTASELALLQQIAQPDLKPLDLTLATPATSAPWWAIESLLRQYAEYYFERPIRSAALIETCFAIPSPR